MNQSDEFDKSDNVTIRLYIETKGYAYFMEYSAYIIVYVFLFHCGKHVK